MDIIRWGIIGCGNVTEVKSGPAFQKIPHSTIVAVMRRNRELAQDYAQRHGIPRWYDNADDLINDPEVNAIYVATPPSSHAEYAIRAMQSGKPVYVEKPMALNNAECEAMISASIETGIPLFVAFYRRAMPSFLHVKELIDKNEIGDVRSVNITLLQKASNSVDPSSNWRVIPSISGGGHFHDLASHQFDFLDFLFGPIRTASGFARNQGKHYEADDNVVAAFEFECGILGTGSWCFTVSEEQQYERTQIIGSRGKISFSFFGNIAMDIESYGHPSRTISIPWPEHVQQPLIQQVVDQLRGNGACSSSGATAIRTARILDAIAGRI